MPVTRALVTGGAGFIGHHLAGALLARGLAVTVLDDLSMGKRANVPAAARFIEADVRDAAALRDALDGVDVVFHQAAVVSIRASVEHFVRDAEINLLGTLRLLQEMSGRPIKRAVLASSMAVYADSGRGDPLMETDATEPLAPYGIAKLAAERYWHMMCANAGIPATVLRYFNTYGPNQTFTAYVGVITIFIRRLLAGEAPVIFGDGEQRRDFVHVDDVVAANLAVLDGADGAVAGRTFNVGTGRATSINDLAAGLIAAISPGVRSEYVAREECELRCAVADIAAIRETLGWTPRRARLDFHDVVGFWKDRLRHS